MMSNANNQSRESAPVFLVGMPRSGTKLLRDLLNRHPNIRIPETESVILPMLVKEWPDFGDLSVEANFDKFFSRVSKQLFFEYLRQDNRPMTQVMWKSYIQEYTPAGIFEALVRADTNNRYGSDIIWGDKSPSYINHVGLIADIYPRARVIHIVRDVRDYCLSISKAWGKNKYRASYRWGQSVTKGRVEGRVLGERYLQVNYETLIESPEVVLRSICNMLELEFSAEMLTLVKPSENLGETRGQTEIIPTNKGKFETELTPKELKKIEEMAFNGMLAAGYEPRLATSYRSPWKVILFMRKLLDGYHLSQAARQEHGFFRGVKLHLYNSKIR
ncbi:sulfotransferase [Halieaceae bacterium IMCC14734]|uniref:Sulfotransferase n=1 Tax=Candidatus Litorirhabdus singularis TaxID=2518993 RepID=A0ABT3TFG5_9GAMM|nr:sulfotransferase [Candidatus Litorirhabdus singularis]MCX2980994.1 sulfotransferase [Candidatus Litorirhabdus singularis]